MRNAAAHIGTLRHTQELFFDVHTYRFVQHVYPTIRFEESLYTYCPFDEKSQLLNLSSPKRLILFRL